MSNYLETRKPFLVQTIGYKEKLFEDQERTFGKQVKMTRMRLAVKEKINVFNMNLKENWSRIFEHLKERLVR